MKKRPNVLWLMSDQHNANCTGYAGHPEVKTPNLDKIASGGVNFVNGFANNPICSPSRICFMTGRYMHNHRMFGNNHAEYPHPNPDTLACQFRRYGYQTGLFGKSHMIRRWDEDGFERIRYTDLCDSQRNNPETTHYFQHLIDHGLADQYEEGIPDENHQHTIDGSAPADLPYEHSIEHFTGDETLKFLDDRDESRPFFIHMSFQRPHAPITPAKKYFGMYDPDRISLPDSATDFFENRFASKPDYIRERVENGCEYPLADPDPNRLKRCLASYYALISCIDMEIGRVLDRLENMGELDNTIIFYTADHGDFAGEHGLFHKNLGIYESVHRIPFILSWPSGPKNVEIEGLVESVDWFPTICELCDVPLPETVQVDGRSLVPLANHEAPGRDAVFCEWEWGGVAADGGPGKISAIRTDRYRLVYYNRNTGGELYDRKTDPGEIDNLWNNPEHLNLRLELTEQLFDFILKYRQETGGEEDARLETLTSRTPTRLLHKSARKWSRLQQVYGEK